MVYIETVAAEEAVVIAENKVLSKSMRWLNQRGKWNKVVAIWAGKDCLAFHLRKDNVMRIYLDLYLDQTILKL